MLWPKDDNESLSTPSSLSRACVEFISGLCSKTKNLSQLGDHGLRFFNVSGTKIKPALAGALVGNRFPNVEEWPTDRALGCAALVNL